MKNFKLRFIPLGGITEVTKNMYVYELYENDYLVDVLIVDCGVGFLKDKQRNGDCVIPDAYYLKDKIDKIRAVLLTHGHEDHITGLRFLYNQLGQPPVFASRLTAILTGAKFAELGLSANINVISYRRDYRFGHFSVRFIHLTHSIPDTTHLFIKTPAGNFYHGGDFKLDLTPPYGPPPDFAEIKFC